MKLVKLPAKMVLLHGTTKKFAGLPKGPAWFTEKWETAADGGYTDGRHPRVIVAKTVKPVSLIGIEDTEGYTELVFGTFRGDKSSDLRRAMDEIGFKYKPAKHWGERAGDQNKFAAAVCEAGYDGWIVHRYYTPGGKPGSDIVICNPEDALVAVKVIDVSGASYDDLKRLRPRGTH